MADMKKVYKNLMIINLYYQTPYYTPAGSRFPFENERRLLLAM